MEQDLAASCNLTQCDPSMISCHITPSEHCYDIACSDNCSCLTESQAQLQGYDITDKCRTCACDNNTSPPHKYCYPRWSPCNTTCGTCMLDTEAASYPTLTLCPDTTPCAPPSQGSKHCYTLCPSPCNCVRGVFPSDNLTKCGERTCPLGGFGSAYCWRCPDGCECKADNDPDLVNYTPCYTGECGGNPAEPKHCYRYTGGKSLPSGGCCANGKVSQATQSQCVQIGGKWYTTEAQAMQACQPMCWCCRYQDHAVGYVTVNECSRVGTCYSTQGLAMEACQPPCWCCSGGKVYQATQAQCAQMGGACYNDQSQATKACQQAPIPPRDMR
jgi:hypothetical protein